MQRTIRRYVLGLMVVLLVMSTPAAATEGLIVEDATSHPMPELTSVPAEASPTPLLSEVNIPPAEVTPTPPPTLLPVAGEAQVPNSVPEDTPTPHITVAETPAQTVPPPYADVVLGPIRAEADVIVTGVRVSERLERLELYNTASTPVDLSRYVVDQTVLRADDTERVCSLQLDGYLLGRNYAAYALRATDSSGDVLPAYAHVFDDRCHEDAVGVVSVEVYLSERRVERLYEVDRATLEPGNWVRKGVTTADGNRSGILRVNFNVPIDKDKNHVAHLFRSSELYLPPASVPLEIQEILIAPSLCAPQVTDPVCRRYVKVKNTSDTEVDLSKFRLRAGDPARNATNANTTYTSGMVPPGATYVIDQNSTEGAVYLASAEGTVWFEDVYGIMQYESRVTPYSGADRVANKARSWAYDSELDVWRWGVPSPHGANLFVDESPGMGSVSSSSLKPCRDDQYRSEETNRCRNLSATSGLQPCKEGQYRSEETNRCRSIASAASVPKPCADDQFRNPATGRCKKIASTDELADCGEGRERNPTTNRCRNVALASIPGAAFKAETITQGAEVFVGWWALGGVLVLALGYAAWEWRREVAVLVGRATSFVLRQK